MKRNSLTKELKAYLKRADKWLKLKKGTRFNKEQNTVIKFVVPLLEMLGWDPLSLSNSKDVEFEYHLKDKRHKTRHVDIALYTKTNTEIPKFLIEVKPIQTDIINAARQIFRDYLSGGKVTYCIATNGKELIVFDKRFVKHSYKKARILFKIKQEDFIEFIDVLWLLSKDMTERGDFDRIARLYHSNDKYWHPWFQRMRKMIYLKRFDKLAKIYESESYWKERWKRKERSTKEFVEYILPLVICKKIFLGK